MGKINHILSSYEKLCVVVLVVPLLKRVTYDDCHEQLSDSNDDIKHLTNKFSASGKTSKSFQCAFSVDGLLLLRRGRVRPPWK